MIKCHIFLVWKSHTKGGGGGRAKGPVKTSLYKVTFLSPERRIYVGGRVCQARLRLCGATRRREDSGHLRVASIAQGTAGALTPQHAALTLPRLL